MNRKFFKVEEKERFYFKIGDRLIYKPTRESGVLIEYNDLGLQRYEIVILMDNGDIVKEKSLKNYIKITTFPTK